MTLTIDPTTYVHRRERVAWQTALGGICSDLSDLAGRIDDATVLATLSSSEDAERDAQAVIKAAGVMVDALMQFEKRYVRAE